MSPTSPRDGSNLYSCEKSGLNSMVHKTKQRLGLGKERLYGQIRISKCRGQRIYMSEAFLII